MANLDDPGSMVLDLFREHGQAIYHFAMVLGRSRDDAEDVVQETFLKLLTHLKGGGDTTNLRGWLFTVAAHGCRDRMRRRLRWLPWTPADEPSVEPAPSRTKMAGSRRPGTACSGLRHAIGCC